jgi:hypothetical protein
MHYVLRYDNNSYFFDIILLLNGIYKLYQWSIKKKSRRFDQTGVKSEATSFSIGPSYHAKEAAFRAALRSALFDNLPKDGYASCFRDRFQLLHPIDEPCRTGEAVQVRHDSDCWG